MAFKNETLTLKRGAVSRKLHSCSLDDKELHGGQQMEPLMENVQEREGEERGSYSLLAHLGLSLVVLQTDLIVNLSNFFCGVGGWWWTLKVPFLVTVLE